MNILKISFLVFILSTVVSAQNHWIITNASLGSKVTDIVTNYDNEVFASTKYNGIYFSSDYGENWVSINNGLQSNNILSLAISPATQTILSLDNYGVYRSTDNGSTWIFIDIQPFPGIYNLDCNLNGDFFGGTALSGVIKSTDDGITWHLSNTGLNMYSIPSFAFEDTVMVFCSGGGTGSVFRSSDFGNSWMEIFILYPMTSSYVSSLAAYNGLLYAGTDDDGVFATDYNQINWIAKNNGLENISIVKIKINSYGYIYIATQNGGIFRSLDLGDSWSEFNSGLTELAVSSLAITLDEFLYCGTDSGQIFRSSSATTLGLNNRDLTKRWVLNQNYPNPFNPSTTIKYEIPEINFVKISVYDLLGREIATVVNEEKPVGTYEVQFEEKGLTSGIYFYRLQTDSFVETKKMILLK